MTRRTFYALVLTVLVGMVAGLLELVYQLVCDEDPGTLDNLGPRFEYAPCEPPR